MPSAVVDTQRELVALGPDVILASGDPVMALHRATRTVPIVFTIISDPVGVGLVESLAHPGGNVTGFMSYEHGFGAKWLELLKEIAPGVKRAAVIRNADESTGIAQFSGIQGVAPTLGVELRISIGVRDAGEIERAVTAFAGSPNGGLIVTGSAPAAIHHDVIVTLAAQHKLPAVYFGRFIVAAGGLISYRPDLVRRGTTGSRPAMLITSQGRDTGWHAGAGTHQVRTHHKS